MLYLIGGVRVGPPLQQAEAHALTLQSVLAGPHEEWHARVGHVVYVGHVVQRHLQAAHVSLGGTDAVEEHAWESSQIQIGLQTSFGWALP